MFSFVGRESVSFALHLSLFLFLSAIDVATVERDPGLVLRKSSSIKSESVPLGWPFNFYKLDFLFE